MTDNLKHLLGGYATGTLTPEENAALIEAALDDQELFDALADDEALRRYLADPAFRKDLLKATAPRPARVPWVAGLVVAAASLSIGFFWMTHRDKEPVVQLAVVRPPVLQPAPPALAPEQTVANPPKQKVKVKKAAPSVSVGQLSTDSASIALEAAAPVPKAGAPAAASVAFASRPAVRNVISTGALMAPPIVTGKITDVNAAIVTVNVGTKAGVKIGDRLDLFHDNSPIGYITISVTDLEYSVGKYTGATTPVIGDTAATPKK